MGWGDQPKWNPKEMLVPFDSKGDLATYTYGNVNWVRVYSFKSTMKVVGYWNSTGSAGYDLEDEKGFKYPIYVKQFLDVLQTRSMTNGVIEESIWTYRKQGRQYSILLDASETQP